VSDSNIVHVVDDDEAVRDSVRFLLEASGYTVISHETAESFMATSQISPGGCVLTDIRMPGLDGLALQRRLREQATPTAVIVMTGHGEVPLAVQAMKNGAVDFLEKPFEEQQLLSAVERALAAAHENKRESASNSQARALLATLTPREREVLDGLVAGHSTKSIALTLGASPRTIEVHRTRVMAKLQAHSLPELVRILQNATRTSPPLPHSTLGLN